MAILVRTTGTGEFRGHETSIGPYQYSEGSMPHDIFDDSGEIGQLSFQAEDVTGRSILLFNDHLELEDEFYGLITGRINGFSYNNGFIDITGVSRLNLINTEAVVTPEVTTVDHYVRSICSAASITTDIVVSPTVSTQAIITPGYEGNLWVLLKQFAAVHQLDVSLVRNTIYVRPMRDREVSLQNVSNEILSLTEGVKARKFRVFYYEYERLVDQLAYPVGGWVPETEVYSVDANESITFDLPVSAYLESVKQPTVLDTVPKDYSGPDSVYTVSGNDGLPVPAALWRDFGGGMSFELVDLGRTIRVTLRGPTFQELSPYSLAISDGATQYSTLRIVGTGVFFDRKFVTISTGLTEEESPQEFGQDIDNVFISTKEEAIDAGVRARRHYSLPTQNFETSARRLETPDFRTFDYFILDDATSGVLDQNVLAYVLPENSIIVVKTFEQYESTLPSGYTFTDFNDTYSTATFNDFLATVQETVSQSFGTVSGSRIRFTDAFYRIRSTSISQQEISAVSDFDTLFSDFNNTFAEAL